MSLRGKRALVTGGSRGVGAATVKMLAERGVSVAVNYVTSVERAQKVVMDARDRGVNAESFAADVSSPDAACALVASAAEALGGLDILINNAATTRFAAIDDLESVDDEAWEAIFATNVRGLFNVTRAAASHLRVGGGGVVVNVGSVAGIGDSGSSIPYCASKAAVHSLTRTLAKALAPEVRVNCVAPGFVNTEWHSGHPDPSYRPTNREKARTGSYLQRICEPEDVADAIIAFVAHNRHATGQVLMLHGGKPV